MQLKTYFTITFLTIYIFLGAQNNVAINNTGLSADPSAILDIQSENKGLLVPRLSSANRMSITSPATGLMVFDLDKNRFFCYAGSEWVEVMAGFTTLLTDTDADTKVQVEQMQDEDVIRFTIDSTEQWAMTGSRLEPGNSAGSVFIGVDAGAGDTLMEHSNIAIGRGALKHNFINPGNIAIGDSALYNSGIGASVWFIGDDNVAIGRRALFSNRLGDDNTAVGSEVLSDNIGGGTNSALGYYALRKNVEGDYNSAFGAYSMMENIYGERNTALGHKTLRSNVSGDNNVASGANAMQDNISGSYNTADGYFALLKNLSGNYNSAHGFASLLYNETGGYNTANGQQSLSSNTSGSFNTASGSEALYSNTDGLRNTGIGVNALHSNTTGSFNVAIGNHALYKNIAKSNLVAVGDSALFFNGQGVIGSVQGSANTAIGSKSLLTNTTGYRNTALGSRSLTSNTTGTSNSAVGYTALNFNTSGSQNVAFGTQALYNNVSGNYNSANGYRALRDVMSGSYNTGLGAFSLAKDTSGSHNTAIGYYALGEITDGTENAGVGAFTLYSNTSGDKNAALGHFAGAAPDDHTRSGNVFLGYYAGYYGQGDNKLYIENSSSATPLVYGEFDNDILAVNGSLGIGTHSPITALHVEGGTDTDLADGGYLTLGSTTSTNISFDNNEIQARDNSLTSGLYVQTEGGDFKVHHGLDEMTQFVVKSDGKTGIGDEDPSDKLHVSAESGIGAFRVQQDGLTKMRIHDSGGISFLANVDPGADVIHINTGTNDLIIKQDGTGPSIEPSASAVGRVGASNKLFASMHAVFLHGTLIGNSDLRLKEKVNNITEPMKILNNLHGVTYAFKKDYYYKGRKPNDEGRRNNQLGLIAQEVEKILPQLVYTDPDTGIKAVEYIGLIPILVEAVKEQQKQIELLIGENLLIQTRHSETLPKH